MPIGNKNLTAVFFVTEKRSRFFVTQNQAEKERTDYNVYKIYERYPSLSAIEIEMQLIPGFTPRACTVKFSTTKYNGKYLFGNLLVCGDCGSTYRRRTERGKVLWRCATRIEKGKVACANSPTLDEEWLRKVLGEVAYENSIYNEELTRNKIKEILVFRGNLELSWTDESKNGIKTP